MKIKIDSSVKVSKNEERFGSIEFEISIDELKYLAGGDREVGTYKALMEGIQCLCDEISKGTKFIE